MKALGQLDVNLASLAWKPADLKRRGQVPYGLASAMTASVRPGSSHAAAGSGTLSAVPSPCLPPVRCHAAQHGMAADLGVDDAVFDEVGRTVSLAAMRGFNNLD